MIPVDYKRGKRPHVKGGAYDPERVQLCVQDLILREHGYQCDEGVLHFVSSRERVGVVFDDELIAATERAVQGLRSIERAGDTSGRIWHCSDLEHGGDIEPLTKRQ